MNGTKLVSGLTAALGAWLVAQNVGIGTSSPDSRLHVHNPSGATATRVGRFENLNNAANNNYPSSQAIHEPTIRRDCSTHLRRLAGVRFFVSLLETKTSMTYERD